MVDNLFLGKRREDFLFYGYVDEMTNLRGSFFTLRDRMNRVLRFMEDCSEIKDMMV